MFLVCGIKPFQKGAIFDYKPLFFELQTFSSIFSYSQFFTLSPHIHKLHHVMPTFGPRYDWDYKTKQNKDTQIGHQGTNSTHQK